MRFKSWGTPDKEFQALHKEFNFTVDAAADSERHKLPRYWTPELDGLAQDWSNERIFCNPPYDSSLYSWVSKAASFEADLSVLILPVSSDTAWFHDFIWNSDLHTTWPGVQIRLPRGRWKFIGPGDAPRAATLIAVFQI